MNYSAIDLFSGCGGLSEGMRRAGFDVRVAIDINKDAASTYKMNHPDTFVINEDIRNIKAKSIKDVIGKGDIHLLAGCPPCQGFSGVRRLNKERIIRDERNKLILEYLRFVDELRPITILMENVPRLVKYYLFAEVVRKLRKMGYDISFDFLNAKDYSVPQRRKRLVMVGSLLGGISIKRCSSKIITVRDAIGNLQSVEETKDPLHKITVNHTPRIKEMIALIPRDGGSRTDLPREYILKCHLKESVGFNDIYGRLKWDDVASTITGGCLNPSKGRFLHPEKNRVITPREASLLQSFPSDYKFPINISKASLANMIGEAFPPKFGYMQCKNIKEHLDINYGG